jgi:hypothetical protein
MFLIIQAKPSPMTENDFVTAFQKTDTPVLSFDGFLIHPSTISGAMYFWNTTLVQRLVVFNILQIDFAAKALEKRKICFRPQPPNNFGIAIFSHLTHKETWESSLPHQRKLKQIFLAASKVPFRIQDRDI